MSGWRRWLSQPSLPLWLKGDVVQEDQGTKTRGPGGGAPGNLPAPLAVAPGPAPPGQHRHQGATPGPAEVLDRHLGTVPAFLHFLHPRENGILALPEALALTPSEELTTELNHLFGYPVLNL